MKQNETKMIDVQCQFDATPTHWPTRIALISTSATDNRCVIAISKGTASIIDTRYSYKDFWMRPVVMGTIFPVGQDDPIFPVPSEPDCDPDLGYDYAPGEHLNGGNTRSATVQLAHASITAYYPLTPPCADTHALADQGERLMLKHGHQLEIYVAPRYELSAGWVIGTLFKVGHSIQSATAG